MRWCRLLLWGVWLLAAGTPALGQLVAVPVQLGGGDKYFFDAGTVVRAGSFVYFKVHLPAAEGGGLEEVRGYQADCRNLVLVNQNLEWRRNGVEVQRGNASMRWPQPRPGTHEFALLSYACPERVTTTALLSSAERSPPQNPVASPRVDAPVVPQSGRRKALVIGNGAYSRSPLLNPVNDAVAVAKSLGELGFQVTVVKNLTRDAIGRTVDDFVGQIQQGDSVVVFYAGHGLQSRGVNYLPAVDARIDVESDVPLNSINLNELLFRLEESKAGVRLLLVDACRDNPYARSFRSAARGLSRVEGAPSGTLMHFATRPGGVAADGTGPNGLYTTHLLRHLKTPGVAIESVLKRVAADVRLESGGTQQPWTEGALEGEFYLLPN